MKERIIYMDVARAFAILIAYLGHILAYQIPGTVPTNIILSYSPTASMSLLAFISAILVTPKNHIITNTMMTKRILRIYLPMLLCLVITFTFSRVNSPWGYDPVHVLFHALGLSLFFDLFSVPNNAGIGYGLWFVTTIVIMYLTLPIQIKLFHHRNGLLHLVIIFIFCFLMKVYLKNDSSPWSVITGFSFGVYLSVKNRIDSATQSSLPITVTLLLMITIASYISIVKNITWIIPLLTPVYPLVMLSFFRRICKFTPSFILKAMCFFSLISYEFYILQFSFINTQLTKLIKTDGLISHVTISFSILIFLSYVTNKVAEVMIKKSNAYIGS